MRTDLPVELNVVFSLTFWPSIASTTSPAFNPDRSAMLFCLTDPTFPDASTPAPIRDKISLAETPAAPSMPFGNPTWFGSGSFGLMVVDIRLALSTEPPPGSLLAGPAATILFSVGLVITVLSVTTGLDSLTLATTSFEGAGASSTGLRSGTGSTL